MIFGLQHLILCYYYFTSSFSLQIFPQQPQQRVFPTIKLYIYTLLIYWPCSTLLSHFFFKVSPNLLSYVESLRFLFLCSLLIGFIHSFIYLHSINPYKVRQPIRYRTCQSIKVSQSLNNYILYTFYSKSYKNTKVKASIPSLVHSVLYCILFIKHSVNPYKVVACGIQNLSQKESMSNM